MKKLLMGALAATLVTSCASTSSDYPTDGDALPIDAASVEGEDAPPSNDPFLNAPAASPGALATAPAEAPNLPAPVSSEAGVEAPPLPVAPEPGKTTASGSQYTQSPEFNMGSAGAKDAPVASPTVDAKVAPKTDTLPAGSGEQAAAGEPKSPSEDPGTSTEAAPASPRAETPPPYATSTTLDSTTQANNDRPSSAEPTTVTAPTTVVDSRPTGEQYREYQERAEMRAKERETADRRANFAHEGGAWQIGVEYDFAGLQGQATPGATSRVTDSNAFGTALSFNYFPLRSLDVGRLGVGLRGGAYFAKYSTTNGTVNNSNANKISAITYGARATYEFDYWVAQILVPFAFVGYDRVTTKDFTDSITGASLTGGRFGSVNYGGGVHFNLNRLEPTAASRSLVATGIKKYYLSYTYLQRSGTDLTNSSHFLGLRFEY